MPITWISLYCAASALAGALYVHGMMRFAETMERHGRVPLRDWVVAPLLAVMVLLLWGGFTLLHRYRPELEGAIGFSTFLGLNLGQIIPRPARAPRQ